MSSRTRRAAAQRLSHTVRSISLGLALACAGSAFATPLFNAGQLNVYRDGTTADWRLGNNRLLGDSFDNGNPLVGPGFSATGAPATYVLKGVAAGADPALAAREAGGSLLLDTAYAATAPNAAGQLGRSLRLRLETDVTNPDDGLSLSHSFGATLRLSLADLPGLGQSFGFRLSDEFSNGNDYIEMFVAGTASGERLTLRRQDFDAHSVTVLNSTALAPAAGASWLLMSLVHATPGSDAITAYYNFADSTGALLNANYALLGETSAFHGEDFTRLELRAAAPAAAVPEPAGWALVGVALAAVAGLRKTHRSA